MNPIYLDNHSTTRCDPAVAEAMRPYFSEIYGNAASRSHGMGLDAKRAVEKARGELALWVGASPKEIVWTSGATEANNLAILGAARAAGRGHLISVRTEHKAVLDPLAHLVSRGFDVTLLDVDRDGRVSMEAMREAFRPDTVLVSVMAVNNEIGVMQPIEQIGRLCRERGVLFHVDGAQAAYAGIDVRDQHIDLLSLSAHKIYGPKGVGALIVRRTRPRISLEPLLYGGGHERGLRSGTLAVPLIVGMGRAAALLAADAEREGGRIRALRDRLQAACVAAGGVVHGAQRAPNNLNVRFEGVEAEALLLGIRPVMVSTGSACTSATLEPSHVLLAMGLTKREAAGSVRFGLGRFTTEHQIEVAIAKVTSMVKKLRTMAELYEERP